MMASGEWVIEYFVEDNGRVPVREFLGDLDPKTYVRLQWSIEQLRVRNSQARAPLVRHITDKLWELREASDTDVYRILYCLFAGRRVVLLHGFMKKTQKLPQAELLVAQRRLARFVARETAEGKTP